MKLDSDFRTNYLMNSKITGLEDSDLVLLVGTNPKYEAPVLNSRILKGTKRGMKVALIGQANDLTYEYMHLGNTTKVLNEIVDGTHPFAARMKKA